MKQNPFGLYDFLGYLIPGALFLYTLHFFFGNNIIYELLRLDDDIQHSEIMTFIPAVILAYIIGHVFSLLSSFFIENYATSLYGYPSKYIFVKKHNFFIKNNNDSYFNYSNARKIILFLILLPISFTIIILKILKISIFEQAKTLPQVLSEVVFKKFMLILNINLNINTEKIESDKEKDGISRDYFRILYHFIFENSEKHSAKLQNYVALYGFCRNISFIFLINFWITSYFLIFNNFEYNNLILLPLMLVLSFLFFTGFVKFYRRYTLEALMGATVFNKKILNTENES